MALEKKDWVKIIPPTIAVDLDATILSYDENMWPELGEPLPGAKEAMENLKEMGWRVVIYTCRMNGMAKANGEVEIQLPAIKEKLDSHGIPYDEIAMSDDGKISADFYIDDKAIRFENNWSEVIDFIRKEERVAGRVAKHALAQGYVVIYRAVPASVDKLRKMDYVIKSKKWAIGHAEHVAVVDEEPAVVLRIMVDSSDVVEADNPGEYRYIGPPKRGRVVYRTE